MSNEHLIDKDQALPIGGFQKTSLIDYPGKICSIVFTVGCNLRCPFCHNSQLVHGDLSLIPEQYIFRHLEKRADVLDGVTITGGEPLLHRAIIPFLMQIKRMGFLVKLDTNGTFTKRLKAILSQGLVDYVALDYKTSFDKYSDLLGITGEIIKESYSLVRSSGIEYEFRTTIVPTVIDEDILEVMAKDLKLEDRWYLQQFKPVNCLDPTFNQQKPYSLERMEGFLSTVQDYVPQTELRGI